MVCFPSPRPSPSGRGRIASSFLAGQWLAPAQRLASFTKTSIGCPLSSGERVRVRGRQAQSRRAGLFKANFENGLKEFQTTIHMKIKKLFIATLLLPATLLAADGPQTISLWPNGAPGFESRKDIPEAGRELLGEEHQQPVAHRFSAAQGKGQRRGGRHLPRRRFPRTRLRRGRRGPGKIFQQSWRRGLRPEISSVPRNQFRLTRRKVRTKTACARCASSAAAPPNGALIPTASA